MTNHEESSEHPDIYGEGLATPSTTGSLASQTSAVDVAAAVIERRPGLDQMQPHKLLYFVQAASLAWFEEPAFSERIEAWQYGPVVRRVAGLYMDFDADPIPVPVRGRPERLDKKLSWVVDRVLAEFGHQSGVALAKLAKVDHGPWQVARGTLGPEAPSDNEITQASMRDYHRRFGLNPEAGLSAEEHALAERFLNGDRQSLDLLVESVLGVKPSAG